MGNNECVTGVKALRCFQASLLPVFDAIALASLDAVRSKRGKHECLACLQSYLDGMVEISGARRTRRSILLAIHDMKEDRETPLSLQNKTRAQLTGLKVHPMPQLKYYRDMATALLRMEVVVRLSALRVSKEEERKYFFTLPRVLHAQSISRCLHAAGGAYAGSRNAIGAALGRLHVPALSGSMVSTHVNWRTLSSGPSRGTVVSA